LDDVIVTGSDCSVPVIFLARRPAIVIIVVCNRDKVQWIVLARFGNNGLGRRRHGPRPVPFNADRDNSRVSPVLGSLQAYG
jgi:hypothetical protein